MKNFRLKFLLCCSLVGSIMLATVSCSSDDKSSASGPVIKSVSASADVDGNPVELVPTQVGFANNVYVIQGSGFSGLKKVYFNGLDTYFNPVMVTDNTIFVTIDRFTPYADTSNKLRLVTSRGTVDYDFVVAPPAPALTSFNPINASAGETITLYGSFFLNPEVMIGDVKVPIVSSTLTEIKVVVPAGSNLKYVTVSTISGSSTSIQAIGTAFYDDTFYGLNPGASGLWNANDVWNFNFADDTYQGKKAMRCVFGGWNGLDIRRSGDVDLSPFKGLRIAVKGTKEGTLKYLFNGNWSITPNLPITTEWVTLEIKFSDMGNPTGFNAITFQESGGTGGNTILIDDIGFILK